MKALTSLKLNQNISFRNNKREQGKGMNIYNSPGKE